MPREGNACLEWENTTPNHQSAIIRDGLRGFNSLSKVGCVILGTIYAVCQRITTWQAVVAVEPPHLHSSDICW